MTAADCILGAILAGCGCAHLVAEDCVARTYRSILTVPESGPCPPEIYSSEREFAVDLGGMTCAVPVQSDGDGAVILAGSRARLFVSVANNALEVRSARAYLDAIRQNLAQDGFQAIEVEDETPVDLGGLRGVRRRTSFGCGTGEGRWVRDEVIAQPNGGGAIYAVTLIAPSAEYKPAIALIHSIISSYRYLGPKE